MTKNDISYTVMMSHDSSETDNEVEESYHREYRQRSGLGYWLYSLREDVTTSGDVQYDM
jgi:hypothetical protein